MMTEFTLRLEPIEMDDNERIAQSIIHDIDCLARSPIRRAHVVDRVAAALAQARLEGAQSRQAEIDELKKEIAGWQANTTTLANSLLGMIVRP